MAKGPNTTTAPTGSIAPFGLRMLPELKEKIEASAKASGRSMNAEIVARLQASFDGPKLGFGPGSTGEQLKQAKVELESASDAIVERVVQRLIERGAIVVPSAMKPGGGN